MQEIVISGSGIQCSDSSSDRAGDDARRDESSCLAAVEAALVQAKREPGDIDALLFACPSADFGVTAEALRGSIGAPGWSWDLDIASATATFGIRVASELIASERAGLVVLVRPEPRSAQPAGELPPPTPAHADASPGDACSAIVLESGDAPASEFAYQVLGTRLGRHASPHPPEPEASIARQLRAHLWELDLAPEDLRRLWISQQNPETSLDIARGVLGRDADASEVPVLSDPADPRGSTGSLMSFHLHKRDLWEGEIGLLCSIGPQGTVGSTALERWQH